MWIGGGWGMHMPRGARRLFVAVCAAQGIAFAAAASAQDAGPRPDLKALIDQHAKANGLPADLVHKVVRSESNYNPRAYSRGNIGLMQIRYGTARALGYAGAANGLLDAHTNLTYAVRYLAGAYQAAGGNPARAIAFYRRGYYVKLRDRRRGQPATEVASAAPQFVQPVAQPAAEPSLLQRLLQPAAQPVAAVPAAPVIETVEVVLPRPKPALAAFHKSRHARKPAAAPAAVATAQHTD